MKLRRMTYTQGGVRRKSEKWYAVWVDFTDTLRRLPLLPERRASERLAQTIDRLNHLRAAREPMPRDLVPYVESMPPAIRGKLVEWGIIEAARVAASKPLKEHVEDYRAYLRSRGRDERYIDGTIGQLSRIVDGCRWGFWSDVGASRLDTWLNELRDGESGVKDRTANSYLVALRAFCNWMVRDRRAAESPLAHLAQRDEDDAEKRGPFTVDELRRLITTAAGASPWRGVDGIERALIYRVAAETGLRAKELRLLTADSFHLAGARPVVVAAKWTTKGKRERVLGLRAETAALVAAHLKNKMPSVPAFSVPRADLTSLMIRSDMARAGIPDRDSSGRKRVFHSLRHSAASFLASAGVHPKVAQEVLGHSDINLTMGIYTHTYRDDLAQSVAALPDLGLPPQEQHQRATGTADRVDAVDPIGHNPVTHARRGNACSQLATDDAALRSSAETSEDQAGDAQAHEHEEISESSNKLGYGVTVAQQTLDLLV